VSLPPFESVVAEHGATVLRVCRAVLRPVDAEDAWSETFLAALRAYPRLRPDSNVRGWLINDRPPQGDRQLSIPPAHSAAGRRAPSRTDRFRRSSLA